MRGRKLILISFVILMLFGIGIVIFGKIKLKHINYSDYISTSSFELLKDGDYKALYPELTDVYIENIDDASDIIEFSSDVIIARAKEKPNFYGNSIINTFEIVKVIKNETLKSEQYVKVYDNIMNWNKHSTVYLSGLTPIKEGETYLLFLNIAPNASMKNTYIYSSLYYGHINMTENKILENYSNSSKKINTVLEYDYVFLENSDLEDIQKYKSIVNELKSKIEY